MIALLVVLFHLLAPVSATWIALGQNGSNGVIYSSLDGTPGSWTLRAGAGLFSNLARAAAYSPPLSRWVAFGSGTNTIATSDDGGLSWTGRGMTVFTANGFGVSWGNSQFVGLGQGSNSIATSPDGITWTGQGIATFSVYGYAAAFNGNVTSPRW